MLLSELVDQEKSGFEFDDNVWYRIRKEMCGGKMFLEAPAYKSGDLAALATSSQVIDVLKHSMHERIQNGLTEFSNYCIGSGIGPDKPVLTTFDADLVSYWNDFEKEAEQITSQFEPSSPWFKGFRSTLIQEIDECLSYWGEMMSGKEDYLIKVIPVYERWRNISSNVRYDSPVAAMLTSLFSNGICRSKDLRQWDLLKASLTFKRHHQRAWFVWQMAGRQLQFIKACTVRGAGENDLLIPIPVVSSTYRILRPDARRIERVIADQDRDFEDGS
ncbi:RNA-dependent RNA polymerase [Fusarium langsethiae]|uniref:RNA-dependent RNA polymerase n=1 Tax=Fusarium langsethiae TaxID=179993 RepID=A0A0M9ELP1_FUSLA|nr:RNA-dependent RNA polymerase [Fusarium langsethiae]